MSEKPSIRSVFWGDSPQKVRETESWDHNGENFGDTYGDWISYEGRILEKRCWKKYTFKENQLFEIEYYFFPMEPDEAKGLYKDLKGIYMREYNDPFFSVPKDEYPPHMAIKDEDIVRCITHYSNEFINGETVIDLCLKKKRPIAPNGLMEVQVILWQNGFGTCSNSYYRNTIIDEDRKRKRLIEEARKEI